MEIVIPHRLTQTIPASLSDGTIHVVSYIAIAAASFGGQAIGIDTNLPAATDCKSGGTVEPALNSADALADPIITEIHPGDSLVAKRCPLSAVSPAVLLVRRCGPIEGQSSCYATDPLVTSPTERPLHDDGAPI